MSLNFSIINFSHLTLYYFAFLFVNLTYALRYPRSENIK